MVTEARPDALAWLDEHYEKGWEQHLAQLPAHMHESVAIYVAFGWPIGHFLSALFANRLVQAFGQADPDNANAMKHWALFIYNAVPHSCWGSPEKVAAWQRQGGLAGIMTPAEEPLPLHGDSLGPEQEWPERLGEWEVSSSTVDTEHQGYDDPVEARR